MGRDVESGQNQEGEDGEQIAVADVRSLLRTGFLKRDAGFGGFFQGTFGDFLAVLSPTVREVAMPAIWLASTFWGTLPTTGESQ